MAALAAVLASAACLAACGGDDDAGASTAAPPGTAATVTVYFARDAGDLAGESRPVPPGAEPFAAAMDELAEGPSAAELIPALPPGTRVLATSVEGGVATVDLSSEFESGYPSGGSAAELAVVAPLVRTAAEAAGTARVRILVEGRPAAPPGGQLDLSGSLSARDAAAAG